MNLDDLMVVWKSQDAVPLHDVNQTLLHQALRQEEAKLLKMRRLERRAYYASSALVIGFLPLLFLLMIRIHRHFVLTVWDFVMCGGGVAAALLAGILIYVDHQAQMRREQRFGESLRDQINRRLAQLDGTVKGARRRSARLVLMAAICPLAILHIGMRLNHKTLGDVRWVTVALLIVCFLSGARRIRRAVQQAAARKRELQALLKELDGQ